MQRFQTFFPIIRNNGSGAFSFHPRRFILFRYVFLLFYCAILKGLHSTFSIKPIEHKRNVLCGAFVASADEKRLSRSRLLCVISPESSSNRYTINVLWTHNNIHAEYSFNWKPNNVFWHISVFFFFCLKPRALRQSTTPSSPMPIVNIHY